MKTLAGQYFDWDDNQRVPAFLKANAMEWERISKLIRIFHGSVF